MNDANLTSLNSFDITGSEPLLFKWHDYAIFCFMLGFSTIIGIYFGCFGKKQSTADEYLLGGKEMSVFPIGMSLIASHTSATTILGVPTDVYKFGIGFSMIAVTLPIAFLISIYVFMPVFYKLQLTSSYEYLKLRFDNKIRLISSFLFTISILFHLPIVIYLPALALEQGTGLNIYLITPMVCGICIFYTTIGGLKAVVWTDTLQFIVMLGGIAVVIVLGISNAGGIGEIWTASKVGKRLDFDWSFDLTHRDSIFALFFGTLFTFIGMIATGQGCIQKCTSLPTYNHAKKALLLFAVGKIAVALACIFIGLMMYEHFKDCDPLSSKEIKKADQVLPYYILKVAGNVPGFSGLFQAGVFSAALSSLSACLNCLSGTLYEDFISNFMPHDITQKTVSNILKLIVIVGGILSTSLVFVVAQLGGILPLGLSLMGVTVGPLVGLFSLGILVPFANSKGALYGSITSLIIMSWLVFTSQWYKMNHLISYETRPMTTEGCSFFNETLQMQKYPPSSEFVPWNIYKTSYYLYILMGSLIVFIVGIPVSWLTNNENDPPVNKDLISPIMHWACKDSQKARTLPKSYLSVEKALRMVVNNTSEKEEINR